MRRFEESIHIEYKCELSDSFEKTVVAFLNSREGGTIFLGVNETTQTVNGIIDADAVQLAIKDRIKNNILPSAQGLYDVHLEHIDEYILV